MLSAKDPSRQAASRPSSGTKGEPCSLGNCLQHYQSLLPTGMGRQATQAGQWPGHSRVCAMPGLPHTHPHPGPCLIFCASWLLCFNFDFFNTAWKYYSSWKLSFWCSHQFWGWSEYLTGLILVPAQDYLVFRATSTWTTRTQALSPSRMEVSKQWTEGHIWPTTCFVNKVFLEHSHSHLFTYCLWLLFC